MPILLPSDDEPMSKPAVTKPRKRYIIQRNNGEYLANNHKHNEGCKFFYGTLDINYAKRFNSYRAASSELAIINFDSEDNNKGIIIPV